MTGESKTEDLSGEAAQLPAGRGSWPSAEFRTVVRWTARVLFVLALIYFGTRLWNVLTYTG